MFGTQFPVVKYIDYEHQIKLLVAWDNHCVKASHIALYKRPKVISALVTIMSKESLAS